MPFYLSMVTGSLINVVDSKVGPAGSCAAYRQRHVLVTAAHCVPEGDYELFAVLPGEATPRRVQQVVRHENSDVALLFADRRLPEPLARQVLAGADDTLIEGGDIMAFGYPVEGEDRPVGRLFKGHFQRHFSHVDSAGRQYFAGELSIPAPAGLSGGPVVRPHSIDRICAVVTRNIESYVVLDSIEEVESDGRTLRVESRRVINYGISAMLTSLGPWLDALERGGADAAVPAAGPLLWRVVGEGPPAKLSADSSLDA